MKRKLSLITAVLICGLLYTACGVLRDAAEPPVPPMPPAPPVPLVPPAVIPPVVTLQSVDFFKIDFTGITLLSKVAVDNKNSIDIPLPEIDWDLFVIDTPFMTGKEPRGEEPIKSDASTVVDFLLHIFYLDMFKAIPALTGDNAFYKINMTALIPVPELGDMFWPFDHSGLIPIMRPPGISVATSPKASINCKGQRYFL